MPLHLPHTVKHAYGRYTNRFQHHKNGLLLGALLLVVLLSSSTLIGTALFERRLAKTQRDTATLYQNSVQALYAAEAGLEEARARLRPLAGVHQIAEAQIHDPTWHVTLQTATIPASQHITAAIPSLQEDVQYTVHIRHITTAQGDRVLRWGDGVNNRNLSTGEVLYQLTSQGHAAEAQRRLEAEVVRMPVLTVPGALYAAGAMRIQEPQTTLLGLDSCGATHQAGMRTPLPAGAITLPEKAPSSSLASYLERTKIQGVPAIAYDSRAINIQAMIDLFKAHADVVYGTAESGSAGEAPPPSSHLRGVGFL